MRIGDVYVGLGLNDVSDEVDKIKDFIRTKWDRFDARVGDGPVFTDELVTIIVELQDIYRSEGKLKVGGFTPGIINKATKIAMGYLKPDPPEDRRPVLFTVCGAGVPWWVGPDADTARACEDKYLWQPIGYSAKPFPMGKSITEGRGEFAVQANKHRARIEKYGWSVCAYSEGSIVASEAWEFDIKPVTGSLHWMFKHFIKAAMFGPPMREVGNAVGDANGAPPPADSGGVTEILMKDTPATWINIAHEGDLYTNVSGQSGENKRAIWKIIRDFSITSFFKGPDAILSQVLELLGLRKDASQIMEISGLFKAMWDAGLFFGRGLTPHTNYLPSTAIDFLRA